MTCKFETGLNEASKPKQRLGFIVKNLCLMHQFECFTPLTTVLWLSTPCLPKYMSLVMGCLWPDELFFQRLKPDLNCKKPDVYFIQSSINSPWMNTRFSKAAAQLSKLMHFSQIKVLVRKDTSHFLWIAVSSLICPHAFQRIKISPRLILDNFDQKADLSAYLSWKMGLFCLTP